MNAPVSRVLALLLFSTLPFIAEAGKPAPPANEKVPAKPLVLEKAESIRVKSFVFEKADLNECITYLRRKSQEEDPEKPGGLNFETWPDPSTPLVTLSLKNASVWEISQQIAKATGLVVSISNFRIIFHQNGQRPEPRQDEVFYEPPPLSPEKPVVLEKAESIKLKSFVVEKWELHECLSYLKRKSVREDPEKDENKKGLGFIWDSGDSAPPLVTLSLKNASVWEISQKIAKATGLVVSVSNFKIHLHPKGKRPEPMEGEVFYDLPPKPASKGRKSS
jgi:hypothetical protein